jgi:PIN domain nuclease of toxin-antitoxin system
MKYLADTHLLLWAGGSSKQLGKIASALLSDPANEVLFSTASIWEVSVKFGLGRDPDMIAPEVFRRGLLAAGFRELAITSEHAIAAGSLPHHHEDPFDRMLVAQALAEGVILLTNDKKLALYPGTRRV